MRHLFRLARFFLLPLAIALSTAGCHKDAALAQADNNQAGGQEQGSDPAAANLPPVPDNSGAPAPASSYQQGRRPGAPYQSPDQSSYDPGYGEQPEYTADQPPPPLLDYDQPYDPGDDYIWTPGYWAWSPDGYYWVPGAWVEAPYEGALWTPGYWGYWDNSYRFYRATGASTSATMAASTTALATPAMATRAAIGAADTSTTTARSIT